MKKGLSILGILVAIILVIWVLIAWQTGKTLEERLDVEVAEMNAQLTKLGENSPSIKAFLPQVAIKSFSRGILSSDIQWIVNLPKSAESTPFDNDKSELSHQHEIIIDGHIEHGAFPLSQFKYFIFSPNMAFIHLRLPENTLSGAWQTSSKKPILSIDSVLGYRGNNKVFMRIAESTFKEKDASIKLADTQIELGYNKHTGDFKGKMLLPSLMVEIGDKDNAELVLDLEELNSSFELMPINNSILHVGKYDVSLKKFQSKLPGGTSQDGYLVTDIKGHAQSEFKNDNYSGKSEVHVGAIQIGGIDFGKIHLEERIANIDIHALEEFISVVMNRKDAHYDEATLLTRLLKNTPTIGFEFSWENQAGKSNTDLSVKFKSINSEQTKALKQFNFPKKQLIETLLENAKFSLQVSKPMLIEFVTHGLMSQKSMSQEQAKEEALVQINEMITMLQGMKGIKVGEQSISVDLDYADGQAHLNGEEFPLESL